MNEASPRARWAHWCSAVAPLVVAAMVPTWLDAHLGVSSPIRAQLVNALIPMLLFLLAWGLLGRAWVAVAVEVAFLLAVRHVADLKKLYLGTDIVYRDLSMVRSIIENPQLMFAYVPKSAVAALLLVVVLCVLGMWLTRRRLKSSPRVRAAVAALGVMGCVGVASSEAPDTIPSLRWEVFGQLQGAQEVGAMGNLLLGRLTILDVVPVSDAKAAEGFWANSLVVDAKASLTSAGENPRPDIILIQSESLFDPATLQGFPSDRYLKDIMDAPRGHMASLEVPVFGGRTLQTEFEVVAGQSIAHYPRSMYIYYEAVNQPMNAFPRYLGSIGYRTLAMHPARRGFWHRRWALPLLGFDTFVDESAFVQPTDYSNRGHVSDLALTKAILAELDSATAPTMVMGITMDNHGPWGEFPDPGIELPESLGEPARAELSDYAARARDANAAFAYLIDSLKRRERPTLVVLYGDHLPSLPETFGRMKFADGKRPEQQLPPVRVWANFEIPTIPNKLPSYLLPGWILRAAGLPLSDHFLANALLGQVMADPAVDNAEKSRLIRQYGHLAALSLTPTGKLGEQSATTLTGEGLAKALESRLQARTREVKESVHGAEAEMSLGWGGKAIVLDTSGMVSVTFRSYFDSADLECQRDAQAGSYRLNVLADGALVYQSVVAPNAMQMVTLDTNGVRQLKFSTTAPASGAVCKKLIVRIPQVQCALASCDANGASVGKSKSAFASRSLRHDFYRQDRLGEAAMTAWRSPANNVSGMVGRMFDEQVGHSKFEIRDNERLFMHPASGRDAWAEFDVSGLGEVLIKPGIEPLSDECLAHMEPGKEAGVVGFSVTLDGRSVVTRAVIDRGYKEVLALTVGDAKRLRLTVDQGNQVDWCDWFSVGFPEVRVARGGAKPRLRCCSKHALILSSFSG